MAGPDSRNDSNNHNHTFHPQDLINETLKTTLIMGGAGLFASTVQNTLQKRNVGPMGVFTVTGRTIGTFARSMPHIVGKAVAIASILGLFDYCGGRLSGWHKPHEEDEFERREALRTNYRTPVEQTVAEIGERRGIAPPGYLERRQQRIKQNYGIEVPLEHPSTQP
ncbi:hypothetical protein AAP_04663 [Ascosphaera apis ARSEF 7405]|uniref:NADH-ubiquinone oxidoreductase 21.3 kDa subunit n=1 Tax=Ascosphaera apis ARSEF 7405 TaxID=392613 RepID=A0A167WHY4_9EURO|nr:hypothetical protein AAP_04663 [Ascosphaera apis ARSEF 7405]